MDPVAKRPQRGGRKRGAPPTPPLSAAERDRVNQPDVLAVIEQVAVQATPWQLRRQEWAVSQSRDSVLKVVLISARTWDPVKYPGVNFIAFWRTNAYRQARSDWFRQYKRNVARTSLSDPTTLDSDGEVGDLIEQTREPDPADAFDREHLQHPVTEMLRHIHKDDREILEDYFGLHDGCPKTLEEVGQRFGVSRERIRQRVARCVTLLRIRLELRGIYE